MKQVFFTVIFCLFVLVSNGQNKLYTLEAVIDYALQHNYNHQHSNSKQSFKY